MINQISVFLENKAGQLSGITKALSANEINIRAINIAESTEYGVIRLVVSDYHKALNVLVDEGYVVSVTKVAAVQVPDVPGGLNLVLSTISGMKIDIEYMYSMLGKDGNTAYMIFKVPDADLFNDTIRKSGLKTVDEI
ncbi:MAG: ACT domain-containing protein [Candidatus Alectryocaccobium sp.]|jgi:hypothetical protein|nr:ACT domain-containing protein [Lachnospiraceae bacterium]MDY6222067.1 ACT domain-containing protein [Candidatus Alectryocaccobium sp.]